MRLTKLDTRSIRHGLALLCAGLLLTGCGLGKGRGDLDTGAKYLASGQYRAAYIEAKKVLQHDDKSGNAWLLLGEASLKLGNPKDALSELEKAKANGAPTASWVVPMGQTLLMSQQYDKLLGTLPPDPSLAPAVGARVEALRGDAYRELKQVDQARQSYQAALALDPKAPQALTGLARLAATENDAAAADKYVQQALAASPESPQAWMVKGDLAFDRGDFAGAEADYQKLLGFKNPDWLPLEHFYTLFRLANAQLRQNHLDQALASIQTLEKMSPQQPYPHYLHAVVLYRQGHLEEALSQLQQVLKVAPDNPQAQLLMGAVSYAQGNYGQAEMYLSNVMGTDRKNVEARKLLALTYYREGRSRQALDMLRPAVPGTPTDTELVALLQRAATQGPGAASAAGSAAGTSMTPPATPATTAGHATGASFEQAGKALASGNPSEAIRLLRAIPAGDAATEARRAPLLVMAYVRAQRPDDAVKTAADYAAKHPGNSAAHLLYGTALVAAGKRIEARAQYVEAHKLDPKNVEVLLSLGSLDSLERHYEDAAGRYQAILKQDPKNAAAMTALGRLAALQNDKAQAIKWLKQAITAAPKSAAAYIGLVTLYSESGQFDEAADTARQLADADPGNPAALNALGVAELNAGHQGKAMESLQQAVKLAPHEALFRTNLARAQILAKDTTAAANNLDMVIKADPGQVTAVTLRAFLKQQAHDLPGAIALAQTLQTQPANKVSGYALEGDLYMADKAWDKAAHAYQQGLKVAYERPLVIKSFQAQSEGAAKAPEGVLRDWLAKHPDDAAVRLLLAQYYMEHTQLAPAASEYEQVVKAYPTNVAALNNLAWIYTEQHDPKALALAERAYKLAPESASVADTYAWTLIANNQAGTALPIVTKAAKAAPNVPAIQYHLAVAQARTGDKAAARATLEALQKSGADFQEKGAAEKLYRELEGTPGGTR
ncbi:XrtA/PEP-CTERM system TPR-repeat protein PrsT [Rhodanobacter lindaniclasticus]